LIMWKKRAAEGVVLACLCLLAACATNDGGEAKERVEGAVEPLDHAVKDIDRDYEKADAQHEDVIDRVFAPLDDTVTDINRDLNKGEKDNNGR